MWWLAVLASAQATSPVYLECQMRPGADPFRADLVVDEANQRVTVALETGRTETRQALFAPSTVTVRDGETTWTLSRIDLSIRRTFAFMPPSDKGEDGACKIKPTPTKRAF